MNMGPNGHRPCLHLCRQPARSCPWWDHFKCGPTADTDGRADNMGADMGGAHVCMCFFLCTIQNYVQYWEFMPVLPSQVWKSAKAHTISPTKNLVLYSSHTSKCLSRRSTCRGHSHYVRTGKGAYDCIYLIILLERKSDFKRGLEFSLLTKYLVIFREHCWGALQGCCKKKQHADSMQLVTDKGHSN